MHDATEAGGPRGAPSAPRGPNGVRIDLAGYRVWHGGVPVPLTRKECQVLQHLASRPGAVFPRAELLAQAQVHGQRGRTLDVYICRLRRKLNDQEGAYIQTVRKVGYRLNPDLLGAQVAVSA